VGLEFNRLITEHGTWCYALAFRLFTKGEQSSFLPALPAAQGLLNPVLLVTAASLGSFAGDQTWFRIGRHFGTRLLNRSPQWRNGVDGA
jgi:membrane protein DedA with SNARE-associated domain